MNHTISITTGTLIKAALVVATAALLWFVRDLLLVLLASIVFASAVGPVAHRLTEYKVPRVAAVTLVYLLFFSIVLSVVLFFIPPVLQETTRFLGTLPQYLVEVGAQNAVSNSTIEHAHSVLAQLPFAETSNNINSFLRAASGDALAAVAVVFGGVISFVLIVVFSFYFAVNERGIEEFLRVVSPLEYETYILDLWNRSRHKIGLWLQGQLVLAVLIGVLVYLGLTILGIPYALVLAVISATFELFPVFGPILASVPAIGIGFATAGLTGGLLVAGFYLIIHQFENHLIYPLVVTKVVGVPPLLVIIALLLGAKLAGILGILLSVPLAAIAQEIFKDLDKARTVKKSA
jgi:predicted PurR-regulated permease PerM